MILESILVGVLIGAILVGIVIFGCVVVSHTMDNYQGEGDE